jgi:hypothetical protein
MNFTKFLMWGRLTSLPDQSDRLESLPTDLETILPKIYRISIAVSTS